MRKPKNKDLKKGRKQKILVNPADSLLNGSDMQKTSKRSKKLLIVTIILGQHGLVFWSCLQVLTESSLTKSVSVFFCRMAVLLLFCICMIKDSLWHLQNQTSASQRSKAIGSGIHANGGQKFTVAEIKRDKDWEKFSFDVSGAKWEKQMRKL